MTRIVLVLICLVLVVLALLGMRRGWRSRMQRQGGLTALPGAPEDLGPAELTSSGLYVGTTSAQSWQDRIVHAGLGARADAVMTLHGTGVLIERQGDEAIFIPSTAWVRARLASGLAGKVMGEGGLLVLRWRLGEVELDTGLRADDKSAYPLWVRRINERVSAA